MNRPDQHWGVDRREFLRGSARWALLSLVAVGAVAVRKDFRSSPDQECINRGICKGCSALADCDLAPARDAKDTIAGG
jgi:hypothetical protein